MSDYTYALIKLIISLCLDIGFVFVLVKYYYEDKKARNEPQKSQGFFKDLLFEYPWLGMMLLSILMLMEEI